MAKSARNQPNQPKIGYLIQSRGPGDKVEFEEVYVYGPTRRSDEGIVGRDLRMRPMRLGPGDYTFVGHPDDVEWTRPVSAPPKKSHAQIRREIDEALDPKYKHSHARKQKTPHSYAVPHSKRSAPEAYYVDVQGKIRSTAQPAAPGFTHRLVGDVVQVIAADGEIAFEHQAWFDRAALNSAIGASLRSKSMAKGERRGAPRPGSGRKPGLQQPKLARVGPTPLQAVVAQAGPYHATPYFLSKLGYRMPHINAAVRRGELAWTRDGALEVQE